MSNKKTKKISSKKRLCGVIGIIAVALLSIIVTIVLLAFHLPMPWLYQLLVLIVAVVVIYLIISKTFYDFVYSFSPEHFMIHQVVGSRDTVLFSVPYGDIVSFGPIETLKLSPEKKERLVKYYLPETGLDVYYLRFRDNEKDCDKILTFKPSASIINNLTDKIS